MSPVQVRQAAYRARVRLPRLPSGLGTRRLGEAGNGSRQHGDAGGSPALIEERKQWPSFGFGILTAKVKNMRW